MNRPEELQSRLDDAVRLKEERLRKTLSEAFYVSHQICPACAGSLERSGNLFQRWFTECDHYTCESCGAAYKYYRGDP